MVPLADPLASTAAAAGGGGTATSRPLFAMAAPAPQPPPPAHPQEAFGGRPIVEVRCPSCGMSTMATPGQPSVCFSCGQPLPPSGYGAAPAAATLRGSAGQLT